MSVVKLRKKELLEQLQAKITLKIGRRPTQQELLDVCVQYAYNHVDEIISFLLTNPILDKTKIDRIITNREKLRNVPYIFSDKMLNEDDKDIYGES